MRLSTFIIVFLGLFVRLEAKVFDCFPFFNEFEILKIRLEELNSEVDYFVLVESIETQRGHLKPLYFEENKHLFGPYLHKIIHVALKEVTPIRAEGDWWREHHQRNMIVQGLIGKAGKEDTILISDLDEIPRSSLIGEIKRLLGQGNIAIRLQQDLYKHRLNWMRKSPYPGLPDIGWVGTIAMRYKHLKKYSPQYFRDRRYNSNWPLLYDAGWHFSSMGNNDAVRIKEFSVIEGRDQVPTDEELEIAYRVYAPIKIDHTFPKYVLENYEDLVAKGYIDPVTEF